jgi:hypothetical protein
MRFVKAKLQIDPWNSSIGAKDELQSAWFRVRVIPYDKRSKETVAFVGSLVWATEEIDMATLNWADYVRVRIVARDVCKVPEIAEGAILPYLYDFHFEREVEMGNPPIEIPITIPEKKKRRSAYS